MKEKLRYIIVTGLTIGLVFCWKASPVFAQEDVAQMKAKVEAMSQTIQQMQKTIQEMQASIRKYEARTPGGGDVSAISTEVAIIKNVIKAMPKLSGYYSFEYADDDKAGSPGEFKQHNLSLFIDKRIDKYRFFTELEFEYAPTHEGTGGEAEGAGEINVERAWMQYNHADWLKLRGGKILLPQYWTVNHYPSITVSTSTPLMVKNVFPFDIVGVGADGTHYFDNDWGASYAAFVGNGDAPNPGKDDVTDDKSFGGKLTAHVPFFDRFDVGGSFYIGEDRNRGKKYIWGTETQFNIGNFELLTELAYGSGPVSLGYYAQPSYEFIPKWTAFYRVGERDDDTSIEGPNDSVRHTWGLRYQPIPPVSLKAEIYHDTPDDKERERFNGFLSSVVIFF